MKSGGKVREARKEVGEAVVSLEARFKNIHGRLEPGSDADRIAGEARGLRAEAHDAEEAIAELIEFLGERLEDARRVEEKADRLMDEANSRYRGPEGVEA